MKKFLISFLIKFGGLRLAKIITRKSPRIFMYHGFSNDETTGYVSAKLFEWQLQIIKKHFNPVTFLTLSDMVSENKAIPSNTIVITIDDGYRNFYEVAYPLLQQYKIPATFFVTSDFIEQKLWLWPDKLKWIVFNSQSEKRQLVCMDQQLSFSGQKNEDWQMLNDLCLSLAEVEKNRFITLLAERLGVRLPFNAPDNYAACSWDELLEMQRNGIEIGGHTVTHPSLGQVSESVAKKEIVDSLHKINQHLGVTRRTFCYPNGQPEDYNLLIKNIVKQSEFVNAVTAFTDKHNLNIEYSWRRFNGGKSGVEFKKSLYGVELIGNQVNKLQRCDY
jgi:peptidoglycan/xylan/chitin deacetylase (PgdA/CDA1 family)